MVAYSPETKTVPKRRRKGRNEVPGYEQPSYVCDWQIATIHTHPEGLYVPDATSRHLRDAIVTLPGVYLG
jgi:hypothetical protein